VDGRHGGSGVDTSLTDDQLGEQERTSRDVTIHCHNRWQVTGSQICSDELQEVQSERVWTSLLARHERVLHVFNLFVVSSSCSGVTRSAPSSSSAMFDRLNLRRVSFVDMVLLLKMGNNCACMIVVHCRHHNNFDVPCKMFVIKKP
jgi:hypothetical protein